MSDVVDRVLLATWPDGIKLWRVTSNLQAQREMHFLDRGDAYDLSSDNVEKNWVIFFTLTLPVREDHPLMGRDRPTVILLVHPGGDDQGDGSVSLPSLVMTITQNKDIMLRNLHGGLVPKVLWTLFDLCGIDLDFSIDSGSGEHLVRAGAPLEVPAELNHPSAWSRSEEYFDRFESWKAGNATPVAVLESAERIMEPIAKHPRMVGELARMKMRDIYTPEHRFRWYLQRDHESFVMTLTLNPKKHHLSGWTVLWDLRPGYKIVRGDPTDWPFASLFEAGWFAPEGEAYDDWLGEHGQPGETTFDINVLEPYELVQAPSPVLLPPKQMLAVLFPEEAQ